jgi:hypothetical protein
VRAWVTEWQALATAHGSTVQCAGLDDLGVVAVHANTLRRALLNLVQNALEAMPQGGTLTLEGRRRRTTVELDVGDTGGGIPPEQRARLFEPLHTTKPGGTGLGLYIVQEVVAAHGGQVTVQSVVGQGSTFTITLPLPEHQDANHVNTSVTSVDSSADCAVWAGSLGSTDQLEEPQLLGGEKPWAWTSQGLRAIEHQGFLRGEWDEPALGRGKARRIEDVRPNVFDFVITPIVASVIFRQDHIVQHCP